MYENGQKSFPLQGVRGLRPLAPIHPTRGSTPGQSPWTALGVRDFNIDF